jgi:hypothetical protein
MHKAITEHFADEPAFLPIYLQTVFEGFPTNTYQAGLTYLEDTHGIDTPFYGYVADSSPAIFQQYNNGQNAGTPYTVVIDKYGEPVLHNFSTIYSTDFIIGQIEETLANQ